MLIWSVLVVVPVFTVRGAALAPFVLLRVNTLDPVPRTTEMELTPALGTVMVVVPPPLMLAAPVPVGVPNSKPPVSVRV